MIPAVTIEAPPAVTDQDALVLELMMRLTLVHNALSNARVAAEAHGAVAAVAEIDRAQTEIKASHAAVRRSQLRLI